MEKEFVTYEQALALKKLGFDEECFGFYNQAYVKVKILFGEFTESINWNKENHLVSAPLKQQVFRWFREKGYDVTIQHNKKYVAVVYSSVKNFSIDEYNTYEEAENACIDKLIEIVKS